MGKKLMLILIIIAVVVAGAFWYKDARAPEADGDMNTSGSNTQMPNGENTAGQNMPDGQMEVREFTLDGRNFSFTPNVISVKKGDKVKLNFKNVDGFHDLVIEGYNVATSRIQTGEETSVEFTADKVGTYQFFCSVGNHRQAGMVGTFTVTE